MWVTFFLSQNLSILKWYNPVNDMKADDEQKYIEEIVLEERKRKNAGSFVANNRKIRSKNG